MIPDKIYVCPDSIHYELSNLEDGDTLMILGVALTPIEGEIQYSRTPQKVYIVEMLMDDIKDLWEVYAVFSNEEQAKEKAGVLVRGRVQEWEIEAIKELP